MRTGRTGLLIAATAMLAGLAGCQSAGQGGDPGPLVGAAARAKKGPEPVARPPEDVGSAEDPAPAAVTPPPHL